MPSKDCGDLIAQCRIGTCDSDGEPVKGGPTSHVDVYRTDNAVRIVPGFVRVVTRLGDGAGGCGGDQQEPEGPGGRLR